MDIFFSIVHRPNSLSLSGVGRVFLLYPSGEFAHSTHGVYSDPVCKEVVVSMEFNSKKKRVHFLFLTLMHLLAFSLRGRRVGRSRPDVGHLSTHPASVT